jgi:AraC-like DNA-binding protein
MYYQPMRISSQEVIRDFDWRERRTPFRPEARFILILTGGSREFRWRNRWFKAAAGNCVFFFPGEAYYNRPQRTRFSGFNLILHDLGGEGLPPGPPPLPVAADADGWMLANIRRIAGAIGATPGTDQTAPVPSFLAAARAVALAFYEEVAPIASQAAFSAASWTASPTAMPSAMPMHAPEASIRCLLEAALREEPGKNWKLHDFARSIGSSASAIKRRLRKESEGGFSALQRELKIAQACRLFAEDPEMGLKDTAYHLGFCDAFYFSKVFKSVTGVAPQEYRGSPREYRKK